MIFGPGNAVVSAEISTAEPVFTPSSARERAALRSAARTSFASASLRPSPAAADSLAAVSSAFFAASSALRAFSASTSATFFASSAALAAASLALALFSLVQLFFGSFLSGFGSSGFGGDAGSFSSGGTLCFCGSSLLEGSISGLVPPLVPSCGARIPRPTAIEGRRSCHPLASVLALQQEWFRCFCDRFFDLWRCLRRS